MSGNGNGNQGGFPGSENDHSNVDFDPSAFGADIFTEEALAGGGAPYDPTADNFDSGAYGGMNDVPAYMADDMAALGDMAGGAELGQIDTLTATQGQWGGDDWNNPEDVVVSDDALQPEMHDDGYSGMEMAAGMAGAAAVGAGAAHLMGHRDDRIGISGETQAPEKKSWFSGKRLYWTLGGVTVSLFALLAAGVLLAPDAPAPKLKPKQVGELNTGKPKQVQAQVQVPAPQPTATPLQFNNGQAAEEDEDKPEAPVAQNVLQPPAIPAPAVQPTAPMPSSLQAPAMPGMQHQAAAPAPQAERGGNMSLKADMDEVKGQVSKVADILDRTSQRLVDIDQRLASSASRTEEIERRVAALEARLSGKSASVAAPMKTVKAAPVAEDEAPKPKKSKHRSDGSKPKKSKLASTTPESRDPLLKGGSATLGTSNSVSMSDAPGSYKLLGVAGSSAWVQPMGPARGDGTTNFSEVKVGERMEGWGRVVTIRQNGSQWEVVTEKGVAAKGGM